VKLKALDKLLRVNYGVGNVLYTGRRLDAYGAEND
jgi:hypothetical protein